MINVNEIEDNLRLLGLSKSQAQILSNEVSALMAKYSPEECWKHVYTKFLRKQKEQKDQEDQKKSPYPFAIHEYLYKLIYPHWRTLPAPAWFPDKECIENSNIYKFFKANKNTITKGDELTIAFGDEDTIAEGDGITWSREHYPEFWQKVIQTLNIRFEKPYEQIVDLSSGLESPKWLVGAKFNIYDSCFQADPDDIAIIYQKQHPSQDKTNSQDRTQDLIKLTYKELNNLSDRVANQLFTLFQKNKLKKGDRIAIDMPMTPESVAIYLGIIKAGCVVVSIADSFSAQEISLRLKIAEVKIIFCQDFIIRGNKKITLYERILEALKIENKKEPFMVVLPSDKAVKISLREKDIDWEKFISFGITEGNTVSCDPEDIINILFSSGTTGEPKAIPWTQTTPIKCAMDAHFHHNIKPNDIFCWPSNLGWMMGPWLIFACLINKATIALYEGVPNNRDFGLFVQDTKVNILGVVPTFLKNWRNTQCMEGLDWSSIKLLSSTAESSNIEDMLYLKYLVGYRPIIEYCGGTEIGGAYITSTVIHASAPAACTTPALGLDFVLIDENGNLTEDGEVAIIPPSIGLSTTLINKDHHSVYYKNMPSSPALPGKLLRRHGDHAKHYPNGYYRMLGRIDNTMKLSGIKISSGEIEQILNKVPGVFETAAVAIEPEMGGPSRLVIYVVLKSKNSVGTDEHEFKKKLLIDMQTLIKEQLNPLFKIYEIVIISTLPRTASNKVMHRTLREQYNKT